MTNPILVTGAAGFVGSHLVRRLVQNGAEVHALVRASSNLSRLADVKDRVILHEADLNDRETLGALVAKIRPVSIFHLASAGLFGGVSLPDVELMRTNVLAFVNLLEVLDPLPYESFINVGSSSEYGLKRAPMKETDWCAPANPYGVSKLAATAYAACHARLREKPILTMRIFSAYGPDDDPRRLIARTISDLLCGGTPPLANPDAVRDYIYVDDIAEALIEAQGVTRLRPGAVFNLGSGVERRVGDVVESIRKKIAPDRTLTWGVAPLAPWESPVWAADMTETFGALKWRPHISLEEGLEKTIAWHRARLK